MDGLDIDSKFRLAILAAKRAKQLVNGAKKKVDIDAENPLSIAIEEINEGKINFHVLKEDELLRQEELFLSGQPEENEISDEDLLEGLKDMMGPQDEEESNEDDEDDEDEDVDDEPGEDEPDDDESDEDDDEEE